MPLAGRIEIVAHVRDAPNPVCSLGKIPPEGGMRICHSEIGELAHQAESVQIFAEGEYPIFIYSDSISCPLFFARVTAASNLVSVRLMAHGNRYCRSRDA